MAAQIQVFVEIDGPYKVMATAYRPDGEFLELGSGNTVPEALRKLASELEEWAVNWAIQELIKDPLPDKGDDR